MYDNGMKKELYKPFKSKAKNKNSKDETKELWIASFDVSKAFDTPHHWHIEIALRSLKLPEKFITYDGTKMFLHSAGKLKDESVLTEPSTADTERLARELKRRGMA